VPRLMFVGSVAQPWGAEIALLSLLVGIRDRADTTVVLLEDGPMADRYKAIGAEVVILPFNRRALTASRHVSLRTVATGGSFFVCTLRLAAMIRHRKPDVVLGNSLRGTFIAGLASRLAQRPFIWMARDRLSTEYLGRPSRIILRTLLRVTSAGVISNSKATAETLPFHPRTLVMHDPLATEFVKTTSSHPTTEIRTVGIVGRLVEWKGHALFLRAFARVFRGTPTQARIVGGGSGSDEVTASELRELATQLGVGDQVQFTGHVDAMLQEYQKLDICVHASTIAEPFGQVVAEALASGCLVIATNAGGPAELIQHELNGLTFEMGSEESLAKTLWVASQLPTEVRTAMTARGRATGMSLEPVATGTKFLEFLATVSEQR